MRSFYVFFLFLSGCAFADEVSVEKDLLNLSKIYQYRTQQYEIPDHEKILQFSPQRTGSTLVFNILRYLFEDENNMNKLGYYHKNKKKPIRNKVIKTHYSWPCSQKENCLVVTIRHPLDAVLSRLRIHPNLNKVKEMINEHFHAWKLIDELKAKGRKVIVLRYEDFHDNYDHIFVALEEHFNMEIDLEDKTLLKESFAKKNVEQYVSTFPSNFKSKNEKTLFIKDHVEVDKPFILNREEAKSRIIKLLKSRRSRLEEMGYSLES